MEARSESLDFVYYYTKTCFRFIYAIYFWFFDTGTFLAMIAVQNHLVNGSVYELSLGVVKALVAQFSLLLCGFPRSQFARGSNLSKFSLPTLQLFERSTKIRGSHVSRIRQLINF